MKIYYNPLLDSENPNHVTLGFLSLFEIGKKEKAKRYAFKSLVLLGDNFNEYVYMNYFQINFPPQQEYQENDQTEISEKSIVFLSDEKGSIIKFCLIDFEPKYNGKRCLDFICITEINSLYGKIYTSTIGSSIKYEDNNYIIKEIHSRDAYCQFYCMRRYTEEVPESTIIKTIKINPKNPLESLIPYLVNDSENQKKQITLYNSQIIGNIGVPIYSLANFNIERYLDTILHLLQQPNQYVFSGDCLPLQIKNEKFTVSFLSIHLLIILNSEHILYKLKDRIIIPRSLYKLMFDLLKSTKKQLNATSGFLGIRNNIPFYHQINEKEKNNKISHWEKAVKICSEFNIIEEEDLIDVMNSKLSNVLLKEDIDCFNIASQYNTTFIIDDLFIHKILKIYNIRCSNTSSLMMSFEKDTKLCLVNIIKLIDSDYVQSTTFEYLKIIYHNLFKNKPILYGSNTNIDAFNKLINKLLNSNRNFNIYIIHVVNFIHFLYDEYYPLDLNAQKIIEIILATVVKTSLENGSNKLQVLYTFKDSKELDTEKNLFFERLIFN